MTLNCEPQRGGLNSKKRTARHRCVHYQLSTQVALGEKGIAKVPFQISIALTSGCHCWLPKAKVAVGQKAAAVLLIKLVHASSVHKYYCSQADRGALSIECDGGTVKAATYPLHCC